MPFFIVVVVVRLPHAIARVFIFTIMVVTNGARVLLSPKI